MPYEYDKIFDNIASNYSITTTDKIVISDKTAPVSNSITVTNPINLAWMDLITIAENESYNRPKDKESNNKPKDKESPDISKDYTPKRIIRNGPVTIVFWEDGTKTLVRLKEGTSDDPYMAFCSALAKKIFGNNSRVKKIAEKTKLELPKEMRK